MIINLYFYTNKGSVRNHNEDCILIDKSIYQDNFSTYSYLQIETSKCLLAVADGLGGHTKGEVASFLVLDFLRNQKIQNLNDLLNALSSAKIRLNEFAELNKYSLGLGTVIAGIFINVPEIVIFNVGDSRVYLFKKNKIYRVSIDHSYLEELIEQGKLTREQARNHPRKNIITSAIIGDGKTKIDKIFIKKIELKNYKFLICSDGLWELFTEEELQESFQWNNLESTSQYLVSQSINRKANDNVSFILVDLMV